MKMQTLSLTMGSIIRAWWPEHDHLTQPGPKFRPVFFLGETFIEGNLHWVVAYGTSQCQQHKESRNGGDLLVNYLDDSSVVLNSDTRFDFNCIRAIPATTEYFSSNKTSTALRSCELPARLVPQAVQCMKNANVAQTLKRLGVRV